MLSRSWKLVLGILAVGVFCIGEAVDLGRARSRHRRAITVDGITGEQEMALTLAEKLKFEKFRAGVLHKIECPTMKKDIVLMKFFKANGMNIDKAHDAVVDTLKWKKQQKLDPNNKEDLSKGRKLFEAHTDVVDVEGRVLMYFQTGKWGLASAIAKGDGQLYERTFYQIFEEAAVKTIANYDTGSVKNAQHVMLVNYAEWTTAEGACVTCVEIVSRLGLAYETKYPNFGHKVILVNTALDFHFFFDLIRVVLNKDTNEKIAIFGRDRKQWEPEVTKLIEKSELDRAIEKEVASKNK